MKAISLRGKLYKRLNCFIEQELAADRFTDVAISRYFFGYFLVIFWKDRWRDRNYAPKPPIAHGQTQFV